MEREREGVIGRGRTGIGKMLDEERSGGMGERTMGMRGRMQGCKDLHVQIRHEL